MAAVLSDGTQDADAHLVRPAEQLQAFLMLGADLSIQVAQLIYQLVPLEGRRLIVRLDVCFTVVRQADEARFDSPVATPDAEITVGFPVHVGERCQFWKVLTRLVVHVGYVAFQDRSWCERCMALWAPVHTHVVELIPVDLDTLQAESVTTGNGD